MVRPAHPCPDHPGNDIPGDADGDGYTVMNDCNDNDASAHTGALRSSMAASIRTATAYDLTIDTIKA